MAGRAQRARTGCNRRLRALRPAEGSAGSADLDARRTAMAHSGALVVDCDLSRTVPKAPPVPRDRAMCVRRNVIPRRCGTKVQPPVADSTSHVHTPNGGDWTHRAGCLPLRQTRLKPMMHLSLAGGAEGCRRAAHLPKRRWAGTPMPVLTRLRGERTCVPQCEGAAIPCVPSCPTRACDAPPRNADVHEGLGTRRSRHRPRGRIRRRPWLAPRRQL